MSENTQETTSQAVETQVEVSVDQKIAERKQLMEASYGQLAVKKDGLLRQIKDIEGEQLAIEQRMDELHQLMK